MSASHLILLHPFQESRQTVTDSYAYLLRTTAIWPTNTTPGRLLFMSCSVQGHLQRYHFNCSPCKIFPTLSSIIIPQLPATSQTRILAKDCFSFVKLSILFCPHASHSSSLNASSSAQLCALRHSRDYSNSSPTLSSSRPPSTA